MKIPPELVVREAIVTEITPIDGEAGVYRVEVTLDGTHEVFHVELDGMKSSFNVREKSYYRCYSRSLTLKGLVALMRKWRRGERLTLPVSLANVDFV